MISVLGTGSLNVDIRVGFVFGSCEDERKGHSLGVRSGEPSKIRKDQIRYDQLLQPEFFLINVLHHTEPAT